MLELTRTGVDNDIPEQAEEGALEDDTKETIGVAHRYQPLISYLLEQAVQRLQVERVENISNLCAR